MALRPRPRPRRPRGEGARRAGRSTCIAAAATSPASSWSAWWRSVATSRGPGSRTRCWTLVSDASPGLRAMVAHAALEAGDPDTAYGLLGEPAPPGASEYSVLAGHCLTVLVLAETGYAAGGQGRRSTRIEAVRRPGRQLRHRGPPRLGGPLPRLRVRRPRRPARPRVRPAGRRSSTSGLQCLPWQRRSEALVASTSPASEAHTPAARCSGKRRASGPDQPRGHRFTRRTGRHERNTDVRDTMPRTQTGTIPAQAAARHRQPDPRAGGPPAPGRRPAAHPGRRDLGRRPHPVDRQRRPAPDGGARGPRRRRRDRRGPVGRRPRRQVTAQPTGHGAGDAFDQVLLLRTRALGGIEIDVQRRTAWVGVGRQGRRAARRARRHRPDLPRRLEPRPDRGRHDHHRRHQLVRPRPTASVPTASSPSSSSTGSAACAGSAPPRTRSCSGRSAAAAATSGSSPGWRSRSTPRPRCTAAGCCGRSSRWARCSGPSRRSPRRPRTSSRSGTTPTSSRRSPSPRADPRQVVRLDRRRLPRWPRGGRGAAGAVPGPARAGHGPDGRGAARRRWARSPTSRPTRAGHAALGAC